MTQPANPSVPDGIELTPFDETFYRDPYAVYARLRAIEPIHRDKMSFYKESWTITDYKTVRSLLRHPDLSVDPRKVDIRRDPRADNRVTLAEPDMMGLDDPDHRRLRSLIEKGFTQPRLQTFTVRLEEIAQSLVTTIWDQAAKRDEPNFDFITEYAKPYPTIAIAHFLGLDESMHPQFKSWTDTLLKQGYPQPTKDQWDQIVTANQAIRDYVADIVQQRRKKPTQDLISGLIQAQVEDDALSDDEIIDTAVLLIGAGNFTTTDLIGNTCLALLEHPQELAWLKQDMETRLPDVIEEVLRFDSPALSTRRYALADITLPDTHSREITIKRGAVVGLITAAANHDPAMFTNPDVFNPRADHPGHLAFGFGMHHCLGFMLAKLEAQIAMRVFLEHAPDLKYLSHKRNRNFSFRGCSQLWVNAA